MEYFAVTIISVLLGFILGSYSTKNIPEEIVEVVKKRLGKESRIGGVKKISQAEKRKRGTIMEETEQAMIETLDKEIGRVE